MTRETFSMDHFHSRRVKTATHHGEEQSPIGKTGIKGNGPPLLDQRHGIGDAFFHTEVTCHKIGCARGEKGYRDIGLDAVDQFAGCPVSPGSHEAAEVSLFEMLVGQFCRLREVRADFNQEPFVAEKPNEGLDTSI
jgi:hypothetical protein